METLRLKSPNIQRKRCKTTMDQDAFTRWRSVLGFGPGTLKWIKRTYNKRIRREAKNELRYGIDS
jgi:hypothetical protein